MLKTRLAAIGVSALLAVCTGGVSAQLRQVPVSDLGPDVGLGLLLRQLGSTGTFMMATAHPDDENNGLLALLKFRDGIRTTLVSATRGDGGQNEIGPELFEALAVLRTEELLAAHRFDGAEQFFTRAVDFGNSFSIQESFDRWGREEILGDFVRMIRTLRPDVIATLPPGGEGGGQHHQASAILATEAFRVAADPSAYPEQIAEGLRPWQSAKIYQSRISFGEVPQPEAGLLTIDTQQFEPLLGRTYAEIGGLARSMHKCQGMPQVIALPGEPSRGLFVRYTLVDSTVPSSASETGLFDGIDDSITGLSRFAGSSVPAVVADGLTAIQSNLESASDAYGAGDQARVGSALVEGLGATRALRAALADRDLDEAAHFEIDFRLARKEQQFQDALVLAARVRAVALADDELVVAGQSLRVETLVANQGQEGVAVEAVEVIGFENVTGTCAPDDVLPGAAMRCPFSASVPESVRLTSPYFHMEPDVARYRFDEGAVFGLPFQPTPFRARIALRIAGEPVESIVPVEYRYGDLFGGEKRSQLLVVPAFSVRVAPEIAIVPADVSGAVASREVRVTVINGRAEAASGDVVLEAPDGWTAAPERIPVTLSREDEAATVRFEITPAAGVAVGSYPVHARVVASGGVFDAGYQVVEYPHIRRRHLVTEAATSVKVMDVQPAPGIAVGYVMGVGDQVPQAIEQLGADVTLLDEEMLAWGDLGRFDVIVTGVRAYERRADLRANNNRLLAYARAGGTVIVQYNKFEFNEAQYGPYPAQVSSDRVTDEQAPVQILVPDHPVFTTPNRISSATWEGWVQERGLYFLGTRDERYVDLVESADPFPYNAGPRRGALVEARVGDGRWLYVGLGLWRQLPAGTPGAYQLMANLISLGRPAVDSTADPAAAVRR